MSGAGNDFIVFDNRGGEFRGDVAEVVRRLCTRGLSIGADGVILAERAKGADIRMSYYNADGGRAAFCANGTRCMARFALLKGFARGPLVRIETDAGVLEAHILDDGRVALPIGTAATIETVRSIHVDALPLEGSFVSVGVPHYVLQVKNLWSSGIEELGRKVRFHPDFHPAGVNVDFVTVRSRNTVQIRTYERGVERETLSCGSGCVACALVLTRVGLVESPVTLQTHSGVDLQVTFRDTGTGFEDVVLTGDARVIFQGFMEPEAATGFPSPRAAS